VNLRAGYVSISILIIADDSVVQDESTLVRAHLLSRIIPLTWDVEYGKLRVSAIDHSCAPG